jgi:hypothetical protein
MLNSRWMKPVCRNPAVRMRQYSPSSTPNRDTAPSESSGDPENPLPPVALAPPNRVPRAIRTLIPMRT